MTDQLFAQTKPENALPSALEPTRALQADSLFDSSQLSAKASAVSLTRPNHESDLGSQSLSWFSTHKDKFAVDFNLASYHLNREAKKQYDWNERNYGLGLEYELGKDSSVLIGQYRNSIHKDTHYGFYSWTPLHAGPVSVGVMAGALDGYYYNHGGFIPAAVPTATIETKRFGLRAIFIPPMEGVKSAVVGLQVSYKPWAK